MRAAAFMPSSYQRSGFFRVSPRHQRSYGISERAEVEEVLLGIDGEADSLEETWIADKAGARPVGTQKDRSFHGERLTLVGGNCQIPSIKVATKPSQPRAEDYLGLHPLEIPLQTSPGRQFENAPLGCRIDYGQQRLEGRIDYDPNQDSWFYVEPVIVVVEITDPSRGEREITLRKQKAFANQGSG
ncbi:MAG TPA: hypothetical protein VF789_10505 [Thermoanaerobaculia bacterium]